MVETNEKNPTDRFGKKPIQDKIKKIQEYSAFCMGGAGGCVEQRKVVMTTSIGDF